MNPADFFMLTGVVTWCWLAWQLVQRLKGLVQRLRWALWGWREQRRRWAWRGVSSKVRR